MIQQEMLQYQLLDSELTRIEKDLRKNESFLKRKQYKALWQELDENLNKMDAKAVELRSQLALAKQGMDKITAVIDELSKEITDIEDVDELNYMTKKLNEQLELMSATEKEIKRILRDSEEISKQFEDVNGKMPKVMAAYKKSNDDFNKATDEVAPRVKELRVKQAELKKAIEPQIFEIYNKVAAGGLRPVFVPLRDGMRCGGCQMEMPKAVVDAQFAGKNFIRCEHCGRVIYKED